MATKYGSNATKRQNQSIPDLELQGESRGTMLIAYDEYALTADLAAADLIRLMKLPQGSRVHNVYVYSDDLDVSGGTIDIGWEASADAVEAADADGFMAAVDVTSAICQDMAGDQGTRPGLFKKFSSEVQVGVTINGDTDATSGTIKVAIHYAID